MNQKSSEDETIFTVTKILYDQFKAAQKQNKLDQRQIQAYKRQHIKPLYPHQIVVQSDGTSKIQKFSLGAVCCDLTPGSFCCGNTSKPDKVYRQLGLGMCMYFKFIKHLIILFLLISIMSAVPILFYYLVGYNNKLSILNGYQDFLFSSSIGVLSYQRHKCQYQTLSSVGPTEFNITCPVGTVNLLGPVYSQNSLNQIQNCKSQSERWVKKQSAYMINSYTNTSVCNSENTQCNVTLTINQALIMERAAYNFQCLYAKYSIFSIQIDKTIGVYVSIGIDLTICLAIAFFIFSQKRAQDQQIQDFKTSQLSVKDFAVQLTGFTRQKVDQEFNQLVNWMENNIEHGFIKKIVKVKVPDDPAFISYQKERKKRYQKLQQLMHRWFFDFLIDPNEYNSTQQFIQRHFGTIHHYTIYKQELMDKIRKFKQSRIQRLGNQDEQTSIYMVLESVKEKRRFKAAAQQECCSTSIAIGQRTHKIKEPPFPDLIMWKNKDKNTKIRVLISWLVTIGIIVGSYLLIGLIQHNKILLTTQYKFDVSCSILYDASSLATYDTTKSSNQYTHCYCSQHLVDLLTASNQSLNNLCHSWKTEYFLYLLIPVLMSLTVVIYNLIVSFFFRFLTDFQSLTLVNDHLFSFTIKRSVLLIMNMGLIIILLTVDYGNSDLASSEVRFLFSGIYSDITSDWYLKIGTIVILTMILNISFPLLMLIIKSFLKSAKMLWDKRCFVRLTSKKTKKQYFELYSGEFFPIEERYAEIVAVIYVCLAFSCVMPLLNIIAFLSFLFMFMSDKILIFRVYKKPLNYDHKMQKKMVRLLYIALIIHMVTTAFMISEPNLVLENSTIALATVLDSNNSRINILFQTTYILPYVLFFILLILFAVLKTTIFRFCSWCSEKCAKDVTVVHKQKLNAKFYQSLNAYQINQLIMSAQNIKNHFASNKHRTQYNFNTEASLIGLKDLKQEKLSAMQIITNELLKNLKHRYNHPDVHKGESKIIGMPGYERSLKGDYLLVERNILYLDDLFKRLFNQKNKLSLQQI